MQENPLILIVDDSIDNINLIELYITDFGYNFFSTIDSLEVFDLINFQLPDLILLDYHMPKQNGLEILQKLKGNPEFSSIPVVMVTAETSSKTLSECLRNGAVDYIKKPVNKLELKARIESVLKIQTLTKQLIEAEKVSTFAAMSVTTNHEINQPLTVLVGHTQILRVLVKSGKLSVEAIEKHIDSIEKSAKKIIETLNKLREIEKPEFKDYIEGIKMIDLHKNNRT
ncbi:response regulator [bacterium]|nr:response regulator [bacterium]